MLNAIALALSLAGSAWATGPSIPTQGSMVVDCTQGSPCWFYMITQAVVVSSPPIIGNGLPNSPIALDPSWQNGLAASTTTLSISTQSLQIQVNALSISTASLAKTVGALGVSTATLSASTQSLAGSVAALSLSTNTLSISTQSLQVQIDTLSDYTKRCVVSITYSASPYTVSLAGCGYTTILVNASAGNVVVNLPAASASTKFVNVKKTDASLNTVAIHGHAAETIDGLNVQTIQMSGLNYNMQDTASGQWSIL